MLKCRTPGKTDDAMLRRGVGRPTGERIASQTVHRGVVDDHAVFFHGANLCAHAQKHQRQIAIDGLPPCSLGHSCNWREPSAVTAVVDPLYVTVFREHLKRTLSRALVAASDHNPRGLARKMHLL